LPLPTGCRSRLYAEHRNRFYSADQTSFELALLKREAKQLQLQQGAAVVQQLQAYLVNLACDDGGWQVKHSLLLPLLTQRLDAAAAAAREAAAEAAAAELLGESSSSSGSNIQKQVSSGEIGGETTRWAE
jgi:hypothetical protein